MKRILLIFAVVLLGLTAQAQLSVTAKHVYCESPDMYWAIWCFSNKLYPKDGYNLEQEINRQSIAYWHWYNEVVSGNLNAPLMVQCMFHWSYFDKDNSVTAINYISVMNEYNNKKIKPFHN